MSTISVELHTRACNLRSPTTSMASPGPSFFDGLADRIDAEMIELPRGKDGKPIRMGDTVYTEDEPETGFNVRYIEFSSDHGTTVGIESNGIDTFRRPLSLTHEQPESWGRIADDMRAEIESLEHGSFASDDALDALRDYEARIRALAGKEAGDE